MLLVDPKSRPETVSSRSAATGGPWPHLVSIRSSLIFAVIRGLLPAVFGALSRDFRQSCTEFEPGGTIDLVIGMDEQSGAAPAKKESLFQNSGVAFARWFLPSVNEADDII